MNIQTFVVAAVVLGIFVGVIYRSLRRMKSGGGCASCGHSSSGCSLSAMVEKGDSCSTSYIPKQKK